MSRSKRRLEKLELQLTPQQAVTVWMREAHGFESMPAYVASLLDTWSNPLGNLFEQVREAVETALKGQPKEAVNDAKRQAARDLLFLWFLHVRTNTRVAENLRALHLTLCLLLSDRRAGLLADGGFAKDLERFGLPAKQRTVDTFVEVLGLHLACERISTRYFGGELALFPQAAEGLQFLVDHVEDLALDHNLWIEVGAKRKRLTKAQRATLIDLEEVKAEATETATGVAQSIVDMAKAEALDGLGDHAQATAYLEPYIMEDAGIEAHRGNRA